MGGITHIQERTVRADGTIRFHGCTYRPRGQFDGELLNRLRGRRVFVQQRNYWGTEIEAAEHRFASGCDTARLVLAD